MSKNGRPHTTKTYSGKRPNPYSSKEFNRLRRSHSPSQSIRESQENDRHVTDDRDTNSEPELGSTVPDSEVERTRAGEQPQLASRQAGVEELRKKKMSQRSAASNDTEPISQSVFDSIAARSYERRHDAGRYQKQSPDAGTTQKTYEPGEFGHVDLVSDLNEQGDSEDEHLGGDEEDEAASSNVSPTQTQNRLSQYPESQRFKTPATAGKKRKVQDETVDSPSLPRIPQLRSAGKTPARGLGLSQAFAATQAGTSPLTNKLTSDIRSDRPSPNIAVQTRPATSGSMSSPILLRDAPQRTSSEPNTRYVSMQESQQQRDQQLARQTLITSAPANDDSDSDDDSIVVAQRRSHREKSLQREEVFAQLRKGNAFGAQKDTLTLSSPQRLRSSSASPSPSRNLVSSPPPRKRLKPHEWRQVSDGLITNEEEGFDPGQLQNDSEAETDQEVALTTPAPRISPQDISGNEEDKENFDGDAARIPDTTYRQPRIGNEGGAQSSPSFRVPRNFDDPLVPSSPPSSPPPQVAVADSQTSQGARVNTLKSHGQYVPSSDDVREFVPQSQYSVPYVLESPTRTQQPAASGNHAENGTKKVENTKGDSSKSNLPSDAVIGREVGAATDVQNSHLTPPAVGNDNPSTKEASDQITSHDPNIPTASSNPRNTIPETDSSRQEDTKSAGALDRVQNQTPAPPVSVNGAGPADGSGSGSYETAQTHQHAMIASPNGTKRKAMASHAQKSPHHPYSGIDMNFDSILNDHEFERAVGSSSPVVPPGRLRKRRRIDSESASLEDKPEHKNGAYEDHADPVPSSTLKTPRSALRKASTRSRPVNKMWEFEASPPPPQLPQPSTMSSPLSKKRSTPRGRSVKEPVAAESARDLASSRKNVARASTADDKSDTAATKSSPRLLRSSAMPASSGEYAPPSAGLEPSVINQDHSSTSHKPEVSVRASTEITAPNQVFACFNGRIRAYYPATCLGMTADKPSRCVIQWPGYDPDVVDANGIRSLHLKVGDQVKVEAQGFPKVAYTVKGFKSEAASEGESEASQTDVFGNNALLLAPKQRKSLPVDLQSEKILEVSINDVYLDTNMWKQLADRQFEYRGKQPAAAGHSTPYERPSTPINHLGRYRESSMSASIDSSNPNGIFTGMAFAISYTEETRRHSLAKIIRSNGGKILHDGFQQLFSVLSSAPTTPTKRQKSENNQPRGLSLLPSAMQYNFVALIADKHSRKPKYMQALALGLPCLSGKWIEKCVEKGLMLDWGQYLLPAGESIDLDGATKSRILSIRDPSTSSLRDLLDQAPRLFEGQSVALVMPKRTAQEKGLTFSFLCQALSASRVVRMEDFKSANEFVAGQEGGQEIDWLVVDDKHVGSARAMFEGDKQGKGKRKSGGSSNEVGARKPRIVGAEYICQSLILGSLWDE